MSNRLILIVLALALSACCHCPVEYDTTSLGCSTDAECEAIEALDMGKTNGATYEVFI